jgi:uncharacterized protein (DUF4213/DUF364 family)
VIIEQTYNLLKTGFYGDFQNIRISDIRIGLHLTAVQLSDGSIGTAAALEEDHPFCSKHERDFGEFTPMKIKGRKVSDLFETQKESKILSSLKTACLSAISSGIIASGKYKVVDDLDPVDLIDLSPVKTITIVGAFQSYISKISLTENRLNVLEFNESALKQEHRKYFVLAKDYIDVIPLSDIVIITGQTLVNNTIDNLLACVKPGAKVIVTGPSGNIIPDILFQNKVNIIGAVKITRPELVFDIVGEAGLAYHLFKYCARKICVLNES